jgi:hypothetical protein
VLTDRLMGLVTQLYRRVAYYGCEDASRVESGSAPHDDRK